MTTLRHYQICIALLVALISTPLMAISAARVGPHKVEMAICETRKLTDYINAYWTWKSDEGDTDDFPEDEPDIGEYHTDGLRQNRTGSGWNEVLVDYLRTSNGKPDKGPLIAKRLVLISKDETFPVYLLQFSRTVWIETHDFTGEEVSAEYVPSESTWILGFAGKKIAVLREANELASLVRSKPNLLTRKVDCAAF